MNLAMPKEINCLNFRGLFAFLEKQYGQRGVNTVIKGLVGNSSYLVHDLADPSHVTPVRKHHLTNRNYWVSNDFSVKLLGNVKKVVPAPNPLLFAGRGAVRESLSRNALFIGKLFGPFFLARKASKINARFNRTKDVIFNKLNRKEIAFKLCYYPEMRITKDVCNWNLGIYTELLHTAGVNRIKSEEVQCVLQGDAFCEFRLRWKKSGLLRRMIKATSIWRVKNEIKDVINEYEGSLRERDRLIDDLTCSESRYRSLFDNTATANAIVESDHRISLMNEEFERVTGYNSADLRQVLYLGDLFTSIEKKKLEQFITDLKDDVHHYKNSLELVFFTKTGCKKNLICKFGKIPNTDQIIVSIMDVTEMRRAEEEKIILKEKLARSERMESLGLLAGGVAHDLNNVLSGIVSYPDLILLDLPENSHLRKPIETIRNSGTKAAAIVQDLLTLSRRDVADKTIVNMNEVIQEYLVSPEYRKMISFHPKINVRFKAEKDLMNVKGVALNLSKTIMNLVTNAAEAIDGAGEINITTQNSYIEDPIPGFQDFRKGAYAAVMVSDDGIGIPKKDLDRIFEPFYSKKVMGRSGTGLGMTVVWGTVHDHHGHIDVVSAEGKGTTFTLLLPGTGEAPQKARSSIPIHRLMGNGESVLVVDDMEEQRELARNMLIRLGYKAQVAKSGEAAVHLLNAGHQFDLILLDMIMDPGMDGLDTYKKILEIYPYQKAVIASGYSETRRVMEAQRLGAGQYIRKPYAIEKIGSVLKDAIQRPE
ncbi:MAG: ATP-binding protein [Desulfosarcinaceae bacterium]|nr:ATP-binding protein [Desulfosarcinaceae bacterium]